MPESTFVQNDAGPPVLGRYIDLLVDFAFKKVFGSEPNKDLLIDFLKEVFRGRKHIIFGLHKSARLLIGYEC